jgi:hypothetical protein
MSERVAAQTQQTADIGRRLEMHAHEMTSRMTFASAKKGRCGRSNAPRQRHQVEPSGSGPDNSRSFDRLLLMRPFSISSNPE